MNLRWAAWHEAKGWGLPSTGKAQA